MVSVPSRAQPFGGLPSTPVRLVVFDPRAEAAAFPLHGATVCWRTRA